MRPAFAQPAVPDWLSIARDAFVGSTNYFDNSIRVDIEQDIRQFQSVRPVGSSPYLIVKINYPYRVIYFRFVGTHAQYDRVDAQLI